MSSGKWFVLFVVMKERRCYYKGTSYAEACRVSYEVSRRLHGAFHRDQREEFERIYGTGEPKREWYPDGPFVGVDSCKTHGRLIHRKDGSPRGVHRYGKGWIGKLIRDGVEHTPYKGYDYDEACRAVEEFAAKFRSSEPIEITHTHEYPTPMPPEPVL